MGVPQLEEDSVLVVQPSSYFLDGKSRQQQHRLASSKSLLDVNTRGVVTYVHDDDDDISQRSRWQLSRTTAVINSIDDEDESFSQFLDLDGCTFNPFLCGCAGDTSISDARMIDGEDEDVEAPFYVSMYIHAERMIEVLFSSRCSICTPTVSPNASYVSKSGN